MSNTSSFKKILIANRGAIATRIIRTLKNSDIESVAIFHQADSASLHVQHADQAVCLGEGSVASTYLNIDKIIRIAKETGAQAIHPGYGFLSENTKFVEACEKNNLVFIGPTAAQMIAFGLKHEARAIAESANVPLVPGSPLLTDYEDAKRFAAEVGYPIMLKSTAGGGGIGMQVCESEQVLKSAWVSVKRQGQSYFANDGVFLEKFILQARHIEVQVFGDGEGSVVSFGERDCSAQRRNQKVLEECPAPNLSNTIRKDLHATAERLMASVKYRNAGTVEFIFDAIENTFYFLEVNTRLQVEHGVTEQVWGIDLVDLMIRQASDETLALQSIKQSLTPNGHAIQLRLYAEDTQENFRPSSGTITHLDFNQADDHSSTEKTGLRVDHWLESGIDVSALFDPMLAKIIACDDSRDSALAKLHLALKNTQLYGIETNKQYGMALIESEACQTERLFTNTLAAFDFSSSTISVIDGGTQTTIQDYPARLGYWSVGVPPSGPMDSVGFRFANALIGNDSNAAGLEITINGPRLRFNCDTAFALSGAKIDTFLDDVAVPMNQSVEVKKGQILNIGKITGAGARSYFAVKGGFDCASYLGSKSTFTLGQFGGHAGRALRASDVLHIQQKIENKSQKNNLNTLPEINSLNEIQNEWTLRVVYGPHGAPDFFTPKDIDTFLKASWEVHFNSSRTGVRLIGPKPEWARTDGGEAGLHPSNIHDNAYAFGAIDFTGDMPVILGPDGPSLGGFVCPVTVISADLWKLGQLSAGAKVKFECVTIETAVALEKQQQAMFNSCDAQTQAKTISVPALNIESLSPIAAQFTLQGEDVVVRNAGDHFVLIELGPLELDIARRFKIHALMLAFKEKSLVGVIDVTPGIRSLQIHFDTQIISHAEIMSNIESIVDELGENKKPVVKSRIVHLPLSWDDEACKQAIEKYMQSVRPDAPWCPSNLDFIRRINGLNSIDDVKKTVFDASYLVMGLGDVYLGAPVATPIDPRHRLVTTKYNPARTWTAENSVGIGGAYMCVYGMEGPGGYQFVGRTLQMWNRYKKTDVFDQPWLLRFFDQIKFYEVSSDELIKIRKAFPLGQYPLKIEEVEFDLTQYKAFLTENSTEIESFQKVRSAAFDEELSEWKRTGQLTYEQKVADSASQTLDEIPIGTTSIPSPVSGSVWKILKAQGEQVKKGDTLIIVESMKMEFNIEAPSDGAVTQIFAKEGQTISAGQPLVWLA